MALVDLLTLAEEKPELKSKVYRELLELGLSTPDYCYLCGRCSGGCTSMRLLELKPHEIAALARDGFIEELVGSEIIWACAQCLQCRERCPQGVSPVDIILKLRSIAVSRGAELPEELSKMMMSILDTGLIQEPREAVGRSGRKYTREALRLPPAPRPKDMAAFSEALMSTLEVVLGGV